MSATTYREHLRAAVSGSATPYGYTLTVWTASTVTSATRGSPSAIDALALLTGATLAFVTVGSAANHGVRGRLERTPVPSAPVWAALHLPSIAVGMMVCWLIAQFAPRTILWGSVGAMSTAVYLVGASAQFWYASRRSGEARSRSPELHR